MADKWADLLISAVKYDASGSHIEALKVHEDQGTNVGPPREDTRTAVVNLLIDGSTVCTIFMGEDGKYRRGAKVGVVTIDGQQYLRTDADAIKADNLGSLPRF